MSSEFSSGLGRGNGETRMDSRRQSIRCVLRFDEFDEFDEFEGLENVEEA